MLTKNVNGKKVICTAEEEADIRARWAQSDQLKADTEYVKLRKVAYGSAESQLDEIFTDGIDSWKGRIQSVKEQYPKS